MPSLDAERDVDPRELAARLCGEPVDALNLLSRAGNNRIYRVDTATARYALKSYPSEAGVFARLTREYRAVRFLNANGAARAVPRAYGVDDGAGFALYEWIDGAAVDTHTMSDVDAAVAFIACLARARTAPGAHALPAAAEACTSAAVLLAQIAARIASLRTAATQEPGLAHFLDAEFEPVFDELAATLRREVRHAGIAIDAELETGAQTLSPSDFSFHNALRRVDGTLVFLDFEYFGWDDPVKLVADFLWHPAMRIDAQQQRSFLHGTQALFEFADSDYPRRLRAYLPFFGLKWCLIILNEFLPGGWNRRAFSGERRAWADVKAEQLHKARALLTQVREETRTCRR